VTSSINAIIFSPGDPTSAREALAHIQRRGYTSVSFASNWDAVDAALAGGRANVVVFASGTRRAADGGQPSGAALMRPRGEDGASQAVDSYREGYADGFVDCLTIKGSQSSDGADSPTSPL
jgi:ABC-type sugar transport system substrate-binding protein